MCGRGGTVKTCRGTGPLSVRAQFDAAGAYTVSDCSNVAIIVLVCGCPCRRRRRRRRPVRDVIYCVILYITFAR